jgi:membrane-associated phospholipid phosphatase
MSFLQPVLRFDHNTAIFFRDHQTPLMHDVMSFLTFLGQWYVIIGILIVLIIVFTQVNSYRNIAGLIVASLGTEIVVVGLKVLVGRERPPFHVYSHFSKFASFPSGHASMAVAFYGSLLYLMVRREKDLFRRKILAFSGVTFIAMIGFSRIYLTVHYVSDVVTGFLIGGLFFFIAVSVFENRTPKIMQKWFSA